jgi:hypothetical protein
MREREMQTNAISFNVITFMDVAFKALEMVTCHVNNLQLRMQINILSTVNSSTHMIKKMQSLIHTHAHTTHTHRDQFNGHTT